MGQLSESLECREQMNVRTTRVFKHRKGRDGGNLLDVPKPTRELVASEILQLPRRRVRLA